MKRIRDNELSFVDSIFKERCLPDLDPEDLKAYIHVRTNIKLVELGLRPLKLDLELITRANKIASWFDPMVQGASSNDFFTQSKDGNNYTSKIEQKFTEVDMRSLRTELECFSLGAA